MKTSCRQVVITGMGAVSPLGIGVSALWDRVSHGHSGIDRIHSLGDLDPEKYPVRYAGEVTDFDVDRLIKKHCEVRREKSVQMVACC
jgi:3-oxoacyl-[acyl-carrier-protein] synthase II